MSTAFERAEARLGASARARLSNATGSFNAGPAITGIFDDRATVAGIGPAGMQARDLQFICATAEAGAVADGTAVTIIKAGITSTLSVAQSEVDTHLGNTTFMLTRGP